MALQIVTQSLSVSSSAVSLDRRLYLTEDRSRLVEDGDPAARWLYGVKDQRVNAVEAERLGYKPLSVQREEEAPAPAAKSEEPAEDKEVKKESVEDKSAKPKKKKG